MALTEKEREIYNEYLETLQNLTFNSKPLIDVLTEVAYENKEYARVIVQCIEDQLEKVSIELKLPVLYLMDSIIKNENIRKYYMGLFCVKLPWMFAKVYKEGKDDVRSRLSKLRFTWNGVIAPEVLTSLDNVIRKINPSWQTAHINPKFVPRASPAASVTATPFSEAKSNITPTEELQQTQQELLKLKQRKEELEKELKMLRPKLDVPKANVKSTNEKPVEKQKPTAKPPVERLSAKANECFSQVEKLRTGTYNPAEIQRVRSAAANIKNVIVNVLDSVRKGPFPNNPSLAALAEDTTILQDLISKLEETEKVLCETEKANQVKRKVIIDKNHLPPKTTALRTAPASTPITPVVMRPTYSSGVLITKNVSSNPYVYTKPTSNGAALVPQNTPAFRIAPVSSQLINAAARRRDPRLRKIELEESTATINNAGTTKEVKTVSQTVPNDVKNDKQNALLTDVSKGKEFVSENALASQTKSSAPPVDRENEPKTEKNGPLKPSKQDNVERKVPSPPRISGMISKKPDLVKKKDLPLKVPSKGKDVASSKSEPKPNKIKIKVKNIAKNKAAKMTELFGETQNKLEKQKEAVQPAPKEERKLRMHKWVEALGKVSDAEREQFIENLSKRSAKMAQRLTKLLLEKDKNQNKSQPVVSELMDITDDKSDFAIISSPKTSNDEELIPVPPPPLLSSLRQLDQPAVIVDDLTNEQDAISEPDDKENLLRKEVQKLEEEERLLEANIQKQTAVIKEKAGISSMNLSEQLEAVMNAAVEGTKQSETGVSDTRTTLSQDTDIRTLLPPAIGLNMGCSLPSVSEIISAPVTTATETAPLVNPFGLALTTKDIDYRKLFGFSLPPITATKDADEESRKEDTSSPERDLEDSESATKSENSVKRKQNEKPDHKSKRRRTASGSNGSDSENSRDSPENVREQHYDSNRYSDSDSEIGGRERMDVDVEKWRDDAKLQPPPVPDDSRFTEMLTPVSESRPTVKSPPLFHMYPQNFAHPFSNMNFGQMREVRDPNIDVLKMINRDPIKVINIDRIPREIRHYGSTAVVFMNWDDPRQISFFDQQRKHRRNELRGPNRDIPRRRWIVIDKDVEVPLFLNQPEVVVLVDRKPHGFRLGTPTRELYVDGVGYECCFNGPSINVPMEGTYHSIRLNGDRPGVDIGERKRQDLVAGKISLIINDSSSFNIFLDAKPQSIIVNGIPFVFMFIDALKRVLINDIPFDTNFGGGPQVFHYKGNPYKFLFSPLPPGIVPGAINIFQMVMTKLPSPPPLPPSLQYSALSSSTDDFPVLPVPPAMPCLSNVPTMPVNTIRTMESQNAVPFENSPNETKPSTNNILENLNIDELFQKLVASGIVPSSSSSTVIQEDTKSPEKEDLTVKFVDFTKPETLKQRQAGMITKLYSGEQCGSCGLRFPPESMEPNDQTKPRMSKYGEHLNWHYRRNTSKKGKDGARGIHSRKWYYNASDWMIFQEVEDDADKVPTCFDSETAEEEVKEEVPCVPAGKNPHDAACELCRDRFELIYNHEEDEWQLRGAIRVEDKLYHPACFQDFKEKGDQSDIEEIVDLVEPIIVDDVSAPEESTINLDDSSAPEPDSTTVPSENDEPPVDENSENNKMITLEDGSITIKQEKPDIVKAAKDKSEDKESILSNDQSVPVEGKSFVEDDDDSDVEEVQLIEQPIEEIVIPDDGNDLEPNLETLNVEDIIAVQQQEIDLLETTVEKEDVEFQDKIVDITQVPNVASIDGNIELNDQCQVPSGATKIKINIVKSLEKAQSPKMDDSEKGENGVEEVTKECEPELITTPADIKPKIKCQLLKECSPVVEKRKENEMSAICSIM